MDLVEAIREGRDLEHIEALVRGGADVDRPGGDPGRTPYQHAMLRNRTDVADLLAAHGADTTLGPGDRAVAALARGDEPDVEVDLASLDADAREVLRGACEPPVTSPGADGPARGTSRTPGARRPGATARGRRA